MRHPSSSASSSGTTSKARPAAGTTATASKTPCCSKVGLKRGPWTPEEDELLANYIKREGEGRWRTLPKRAGLLRCGKSCRLRWMNYLRPSVKRGHIAPDEEDLILRLHRLLGNRWSLIAGRIPGRTDNEIKNYWNTHLSKKLISQGIDPRTHKPLSTSNSEDNKLSSSSRPNHTPISNPNLRTEEPATAAGDRGLAVAGHFPGGMGLKNPDVSGVGNEDDDDINYGADNDINYGADDVFSSFLNSLINEDVFNSQHQLGQQQPNGSDPLISSNQPFAFGAGWDAPIMSSGPAYNQNDPKRYGDLAGEQF
ncbi:hypothetical protein NMG60_11033131 [Bertholletia excelsa]